MNTQTTISISEARKKIFDIAEDVQNPSVFYVLTEKGRPKAVILSAEEFESWVETLEVIRDFPDLSKDISEMESDLKSGRYKTYASFDDVLKKQGYIYTGGKLNRKNGISNKTQATSRKRVRQTSRKR